MAFSRSPARGSLWCFVYMTMVLLSSPMEVENEDDKCGPKMYWECHLPTATPDPTTTDAPDPTTTDAPSAVQNTTGTTTRDMQTSPNSSTTVPMETTVFTSLTTMAWNCSCEPCIENCDKCFSGGHACLNCSKGYEVEPTAKRICEPCNARCYTVCKDYKDSELCNCMGNQTLECQTCNGHTMYHGSCIKPFPIALVIGATIGGVMLIVLIVIVCCCVYKIRKPPAPVKRDYRSSKGSVQPADDDVYGNVDNQGNMLRLDMPNERQPSLPMSDVPTRLAPSEPDFGDVYENTVMGQPAEPVPKRVPVTPVKPTAQEEAEPSDFGEVYTNTDFPQTVTSPSNNQKFFQKNVPPVGLKMPPLPRKASQDLLSQPPLNPSLPTRPWDNLNKDNKRKDLPTPPVIPQVPRKPFEREESVDMPKHAPPPPPKVTSSKQEAVPLTLPRREPPPTPTKKFSSLPGMSQPSMTKNFTDEDDRLPKTSPPPPPVSSSAPKGIAVFPPNDDKPPVPVTKPPSLKKKKPPTPKKTIVRHIDDDIHGAVEIGVRSIQNKPVPIKPVSPDFGDTYEVTMEQQPQHDYGMSYEVTEISPQSSPKHDFGLSYEYVGEPGTVDQDEDEDYGGSYESVEIPRAQDYGGTYEVVDLEQPSKLKVDMSRRGPLPLPKKGPAPSTKSKPSRGDVYEDPDKPVMHNRPWGPPPPQDKSGDEEQDFGGDHSNASVAGPGVENPKPAMRPHPTLPKKLSNLTKQEDFYEQALGMDASDAKARLEQFQKEEDDTIYQNSQSAGVVNRYRNVPQRKMDPSTKLGGYITINKT